MNVCWIDDCRRPAFARGLCSKHYQRRRRMSDESNAHNWSSTPLSWCRCETPVPGVIALFKGYYVERELRPGDMVECRTCRRPLRVV